MPSPVVAHEGSTFQVWFRATVSSCRASDTARGESAEHIHVSGLNELEEGMEEKVRTAIDILLIRKHKQQRVLHLAVLNDARKLVFRLIDTSRVGGVDHEDQALGAGEVMSPQRSDLVLACERRFVS